ncbi:HdeA/HdeB family chaperone [Bradyrhizobium sp. CCBAU 51753]|uniref:HdeA/HdeB family chaperone n=1 Tax=Bradyrhizobium sp. CCBAU 51753 TaxID=1325100 RepID=UPI00188CA5A0|nr:HdeA/HdeB family chaperone [Bradyrhizobium sp. CCBAU 51753]QOZ24137.1 hypothetical protein XH93_11545 [Bradyrhizobium sp. CCBAU 51753]
MTRISLLVKLGTFGLLLCFEMAVAKAQQNAVLETMTCQAWSLTKQEGRSFAVAWLEGYLAGASQKMEIDYSRIVDTMARLATFCAAHPDLTVAQAYRTLRGFAHFGCDANTADTCQFAIFSNAAATFAKRFALAGSQRGLVSDVKLNADLYCVCINRPVPASYNACIPTAQGWCKQGGAISSTFNH